MNGYFQRLMEQSGLQIAPAAPAAASPGPATVDAGPRWTPAAGPETAHDDIDVVDLDARTGPRAGFAAPAEPVLPAPRGPGTFPGTAPATPHPAATPDPGPRPGGRGRAVDPAGSPEAAPVRASGSSSSGPAVETPPGMPFAPPAGPEAAGREPGKPPELEGVPPEILSAVLRWIAAGNSPGEGAVDRLPEPGLSSVTGVPAAPRVSVDSGPVSEPAPEPIPERRIGEPGPELPEPGAGPGDWQVPGVRPASMPAVSGPIRAEASGSGAPVRVHIGNIQVRVEAPMPVAAPAPPPPGTGWRGPVAGRGAPAAGPRKSGGLNRLRRHYLLPHGA